MGSVIILQVALETAPPAYAGTGTCTGTDTDTGTGADTGTGKNIIISLRSR